MTQRELNQQIARHTGESLKVIARRGFTILQMSQEAAEDEPCVSPQRRTIDRGDTGDDDEV